MFSTCSCKSDTNFERTNRSIMPALIAATCLLTFFRLDAFRVDRLTVPRDRRFRYASDVAHENDGVSFLYDDVIARQLVNDRRRNYRQKEAKW